MGSGAWLTGRGYYCQSGISAAQQRPYAQRLTAAGDTLRGWWLATPTPRATVTTALAQGRYLFTTGMVSPVGQTGQSQQVTLTCSDTTGRVRWTRAYPRLPSANDLGLTHS